MFGRWSWVAFYAFTLGSVWLRGCLAGLDRLMVGCHPFGGADAPNLPRCPTSLSMLPRALGWSGHPRRCGLAQVRDGWSWRRWSAHAPWVDRGHAAAPSRWPLSRQDRQGSGSIWSELIHLQPWVGNTSFWIERNGGQPASLRFQLNSRTPWDDEPRWDCSSF